MNIIENNTKSVNELKKGAREIRTKIDKSYRT